jgi:phenylpropionate dioxygenase-like ring-hydroxylating dioxygenase large terminal subunit
MFTSVTRILDAILPTCEAPSPAEAITLPPQAYGSEDLFALERDRIFRAQWMPICRVEQVAEVGSYYSIDLLGTPLVVTRAKDGELHVLSRNCQHRWMEVASGSGVGHALQCPYHMWTYGLDGHLVGAPEMTGVTGFCKEDIRLPHFRHEIWQGWVFVNLDGNATPLGPQLVGMDAYLDPYQFGDYQTVETTDWGTCEWDWKIMVDNFMECYHHMGPHREKLQDEFPAELSWTDVGGELYTCMWSQQAAGYPQKAPFLAPALPSLIPELRRKQLIFIVYPCLGAVVTPGFMYWLKILPVAPGRIELQLDIAMSGEARQGPDVAARRERLIEAIVGIHREDLDVCAAVQRAVRSGVAGVGRLSLLEQPLWEFYRYIGRSLGLLGSANTPAEPLVAIA